MMLLLPGCWTESGPPEEREAQAQDSSTETEHAADQVELTPEAMASSKLEFAKAEERVLRPFLRLTAELRTDPDRVAQVGPRVAGRITSVHVQVGDRVSKGDPLVTVDSVELGRARSDYLSAVARVEVARQAWQRESDLLARRATSTREAQEADGAYRTAMAELEAAHSMLRTFGVSDDDLQARGSAGTSPSSITLRSPSTGSVIKRDASLGQNVDAKDTLLEVADLSELWLVAKAFERDLGLVEPGQEVIAEIPTYPAHQFKGRIGHVGDVLDERSRTAEVRVVLANPDGRLKPGMFATALVEGAHAHEQKATLAIPYAALQEVDSHAGVFVRVAERRFAFRPVHIGERAGTDVEILNGLSAGEVVVTDGSFLLKGELLKATLGEEE